MSQKKHFCETCKVWMSGHKWQIQKHQQGRMHIEKEELRLENIRKREQQKEKEEQKLLKQIHEIEEAAQIAMGMRKAPPPQAKPKEPWEQMEADVNWARDRERIEATAQAVMAKMAEKGAAASSSTSSDPLAFFNQVASGQFGAAPAPPAKSLPKVIVPLPPQLPPTSGAPMIPFSIGIPKAPPGKAGGAGGGAPPGPPPRRPAKAKAQEAPKAESDESDDESEEEAQVDLSKAPPPPERKPPPPPPKNASPAGEAPKKSFAAPVVGMWEEVQPEESMWGRPEPERSRDLPPDDSDEDMPVNPLAEIKTELMQRRGEFADEDLETHEKEMFQKRSNFAAGGPKAASFDNVAGRQKASGIRKRKADD